VVISYILDLDQEKVSYSFRDPENGKWVDDEEGASVTSGSKVKFVDQRPTGALQ
jgi:hypothetical protein